MRRFNILLLTCFVVLMMLAACKPKVPRQYLQPQEFEDILYDCHLADAMVNSDAESRDYDVALYRQAVFKKYDHWSLNQSTGKDDWDNRSRV